MRTYIAIDLKSFYASVECIDRGLDPMTTKLYLLTADRALWRAAKRESNGGKYPLGRIRLAFGTESSYTLLCCAKDLTLGTDHITAADLADREVISPKLYKIIETAMSIRRYGISETKDSGRGE